MDDDRGDLAPTQRFNSRVEHYAKYRPGYPADLIDLLTREAGLKSDWIMADIGSGTGILSELFLKNGNTIIGVEPNREMREAAETLLRGFHRFKSIEGTAERTTLADGSVNGVLSAQAFHWFDGPRAAVEFRRIARPDGFIALIWNARDTAASPFMKEYERIVHTYGTSFVRSGKELVAVERLRELFGQGLRELILRNFQDLDWEGLRGRMLSASYMPLEREAGFDAMMKDLHAAFEKSQREGQVRMEYETRVYLV